jgi:hypothetical protein
LFTDEWFQRYVQHKHAMVADTIPKRHNAYIRNLNVTGYPQSINQFAASEEGGSRSLFQCGAKQPLAAPGWRCWPKPCLMVCRTCVNCDP